MELTPLVKDILMVIIILYFLGSLAYCAGVFDKVPSKSTKN